VNDIQQIGVFHHGTRDAAIHGSGMAVSELTAEVERSGDLSDALIVLPEAFNIDGPYEATPDNFKPKHDPKIESQLVALSRGSKVSFVVGLMQGEQPDAINVPPERYSSAFLIDGEPLPILLARKSFDDGIGCQGLAFCELVPHRGLNVACLICADSYGHKDSDNKRCRERFKTPPAEKAGVSVLCIPSHLNDLRLSSKNVVGDWKEYFNVVALSNSATNHSSGILCDGRYCEGALSSSENWILLVPVSSHP
jgi:predicted amidohydrolase